MTLQDAITWTRRAILTTGVVVLPVSAVVDSIGSGIAFMDTKLSGWVSGVATVIAVRLLADDYRAARRGQHSSQRSQQSQHKDADS